MSASKRPAAAKPAKKTKTPRPRLPVVALREQLGLTQQEFATILGLSTVSVSRWEHKHTRPTDASQALIGLLSRALGRKTPERIVATLRGMTGVEELDRIIALVHLGD